MQIIIDTETTGTNQGLKLDEVIQIGACADDGTPLMDLLIKPTRAEVDLDVFEITGIEPQAIKTAPAFHEVANAISTLLMSAETVWFYNAAFDVRVLLNSYWAAGAVMPTFNYRCLMEEYAAAYGEPSDKYVWRSQKLTVACEQQGLLQRTAHNALADAQMTAALLQRMQQPESLVKWGQSYTLEFVSLVKRIDRKGHAYPSFTSGAGTNINVFLDSVPAQLLRSQGYPLERWLSALSEGVIQPLSRPIRVTVQHNAKGFLDVCGVESVYHVIQSN